MLRTAVAGLLHMVWTALAGWGIGLAWFATGRSTRWRCAQASGWLLLAFGLHFVWNYDAAEGIFIAKWALTLTASYALFTAVLVCGSRRARAEGRAENQTEDWDAGGPSDCTVTYLEAPERMDAN